MVKELVLVATVIVEDVVMGVVLLVLIVVAGVTWTVKSGVIK